MKITIDTLKAQFLAWLDTQEITSDNIGSIRRMATMPFDTEWNGFVRDETAARENKTKPKSKNFIFPI